MGTEEAAASLFEPVDSTSDPFASLGGPDVNTLPSSTVTQETLISADSEVSDPSDLFASVPEATDLFAPAGQFYLPEDKPYNAVTETPGAYGHASSYPLEMNPGDSFESYESDTRGWHDVHRSSFDEQHDYGVSSGAADSFSIPQDHIAAAFPSAHDPYAPTSTMSPALNANSQPSPYSGQLYTTHEPYQPSFGSSTSGYTSPPHTAPVSPYDPYKPASLAPKPTQSVSSYPYSNAPLPTPNASLPPPPKPAAAPYRPKTSNAYDPPLPPLKPSKRPAPRPVSSISPPSDQQTYPAYSSYRGSVPPPPSDSLLQSSIAVSQAPPVGPHSPNAFTSRSLGTHPPAHNGGLGSDLHYNNAFADGGAYTISNTTNLYDHMTSHPPNPPSAPLNGAVMAETPGRIPGPIFTPGNAADRHPSSTTSEVPVEIDFESGLPIQHELHGTGSHEIVQNGSDVTSHMEGGFDYGPHEFQSMQNSSSPTDSLSGVSFSSYPTTNPAVATSPIPPLPPISASRGVNSSATKSSDSFVERASSPASVRSWTQSPVQAHSRPQSNGHVYAYEPIINGVSARASSPLSRPPSVPFNSYAPDTNTASSGPYLPKSSGINRTSSPGSTSIRSVESISRVLSDPYAPKSNAPQFGSVVERSSSPGLSTRSRNGSYNTPSNIRSSSDYTGARTVLDGHDRSWSNGTSNSTNSTDPYAPLRNPRRQASQTSDYGSYVSPSLGYPMSNDTQTYGGSPVPAYDHTRTQEILLAGPTHAPYAPSPSLLGTNDPLGRTSARVPVFSFGFGGKVVTCFHGSQALHTGFDVALSSRYSAEIQIRVLHEVIPDSALNSSAASYPGPLFADPGTPSTSLVRTAAATQTKTKKTRVIKYLDDRADEINGGIGYLHDGSIEKRQAEGKLVLVRLLKVMVENDGRLSGSAQIDTAVRAAVVPRLDNGKLGPSNEGLPNSSLGFASASDGQLTTHDLPPVAYPSLGFVPEPNETPISVTTLRPSALDKIQEFLLRGERRQAYHYALDEKLWAHAMIISSSIDKDAWKEVVNDFLKSELGVKHTLNVAGTKESVTNGRESLRVAYSLFSGQAATAVQELLPPSFLGRAGSNLQVPAMPHITPISPNFPSPSVTTTVPAESLSSWPQTVAMMISNPMTAETSSALTTLGDYLVSNQWSEAAHACYLLSPQTSQFGGVGAPSARIVLVGSRSPHAWPIFHKDPDAIVFTEIAEFAMSLATTTKGQEAFSGLPHLQAYKLIRAISLAEMGHIQIANRYCEAISASLSRSSPYISAALVDQLKGLSNRLIGAPHIDKSGSWIGGKMTKPSLDSIGNWLEGRLTKFIAGEGEASPPPAVEPTDEKPAYVGPFSHYSTISSATPSARTSPQPSSINLNTLPGSPPPRRSGSAMAVHSGPTHQVHIDRASSAMDYTRPYTERALVGPRVASANAVTTSFAHSHSFGQASDGYGSQKTSPSSDLSTPTPTNETVNEVRGGQEATWWGSSYAEDSSASTPTANTFLHPDDMSPSSDGFISLMDNNMLTITPSSPLKNQVSTYDHDEDEDLGLGNSKRGTPRPKSEDSPNPAPQQSENSQASSAPVAPERPELKSASTGSWISRWWKRGESTPGPIKASLGEETSFYYDKELKRWVNKRAGEEAPKPAASAPPPTRAQTASPGRTGPNGSLSGPPLARPASAINLSTSPPKSMPRIRSNLVPPDAESMSAPPTPASTALGPPPPPSRPKSQASKRPVRNRYVDVFQQQEAGGV